MEGRRSVAPGEGGYLRGRHVCERTVTSGDEGDSPRDHRRVPGGRRPVTDGGRPVGDGGQSVTDDGRAVEYSFGTVVDHLDEPVFLKGSDGRYEYVNDAAAALFGVDRERVVGKTDEEVFDPEVAAAVRSDDRAVMETGSSRTVERVVGSGDDRQVVRTTMYPFRPDGEVAGVVGIAQDVTAERRASDERERNERALRALQRLASDRTLSFDEKLGRALAVGRERLDLPAAYLTRIDGDEQTVVAADDATGRLTEGTTVPLSMTYCRRTIEADGVLAVERASDQGWADDPAHEEFGLECYLGGTLRVGDRRYGTLCFADTEGRDRPFTDSETTFIELLVEWVSYELERRDREEELERLETIVSSVEDGVYEVDTGGRFQYVNPAMAELTGYDAETVLGEHLSFVRDDEETAAALEALFSGAASERAVESRVQRRRGRPVPCEDSMTRLDGPGGEVRGVVGVVRDVTEQQAHREMLSELVESSRSFMQARDREEVAGLVARAIEEVLGFELSVVRLFDREDEQLVPAGWTDAVEERVGTVPTYGIDEGGPGEAFIDGEPVVVADTTALDDGRERAVVESAIHLPMGVHGTISIGATEPDAFSDVDRRAIELLATTGAAAANRAKREQETRETRERVDTLVDRINGLIENTVEVLVQSGTREELERGVVDQLVATDPYEFAWIARPDVAAERLDVTAWADEVPALADAVADYSVDRVRAREDGDPAVRALDEEQLCVVTDPGEVPGAVHAAAADAGLGSVVAVPLVYRDASYGVLMVYAGESDAVAEREQVVLGALGRAVANAINAIESGRILAADRVVELECTVRDDDLLFGRLSAATGATVELTGSVHEADGSLRLYVTATGTDADTVRAFLDGDDQVTAATVITDHDGEVLFEATVTDSPVELLADHGAVTQAVTAEEGVVRYTLELPYEAEAREVFDLVADRYEGTELVGYHEHERPVDTRQAFRESVFDRFTDRQETAVRTAHLGGFFEWPREADGDDLAESMDISRPTFHQHLRAAQRKVFEELFDPGADRGR